MTLEQPPAPAPATVKISAEGPLAKRLELTAQMQLTVDLDAGRLDWPGGPATVDLIAEGVQGAPISAIWPALDLTGTVNLEAALRGTGERPNVRVKLGSDALSWRGTPALPLAILWQHDESRRQSRVELTWGDADASGIALSADWPLKLDLAAGIVAWMDSDPHAVNLKAKGLTEAHLRPIWRAPPEVGLTLALEIAANGSLAELRGAASVQGALRHPGQPPLKIAASLTTEGPRQAFELKVGGEARPTQGSPEVVELAADDAQIAVALRAQVHLAKLRRGPLKLANVPLDGEARLDLALAHLAPYLPDGLADLAGRLQGQAKIQGTVGQPVFDGEVGALGAALTLVDLNQRMAPVELRGRFDGSTLEIETLTGRCGDGLLQGTGRFAVGRPQPAQAHDHDRWAGWRVDGNLAMSLNRFPLVQQGVPLGWVEGELTVAMEMERTLSGVDITVGQAQIRLTDQALPEARAIPVNRSVRLLDWLGRVQTRDVLFGVTGRARLQITATSPIAIEGAHTKMTLSGAMRVDRDGRIATVQGGFEVGPQARFQLFDNDFFVRSGTITLLGGDLAAAHPARPVESTRTESGTVTVALEDPDRPSEAEPLDPIVSFVAEGRVVDTIVLVQVRGPGQRPELVLISSPPLPEYQILALLITGRVDAVDDQNGEVRRQVAALVHRFHNPSLKRQLFDRLGVDNLGLGFGSSVSEPILTVGKQINRQLYIETVYHHNAPPEENEKEGHVEYRLDPRWTLDTIMGDAGNGSVGVFWTHSFGGPPPPGREALAKLEGRPPPDRDGDGVPDPVDQCLALPEDADGFEDNDGCPDLDNDQDGIPDEQDRAPLVAETLNGYQDDDGAPDEAPQQRRNVWARMRPIPFPSGSARLGSESAPALAATRALLEALGDIRVELAGHSDDEGSARGIQRVSERRAEIARRALLAAGIAPDRLIAVGRGASVPVDPARTQEARAKNRRVELHALPAVDPQDAPDRL